MGCAPMLGRDKKTKKTDSLSTVGYGAGDEARTRYLHLGKVALYRMSYTRMGRALLYHKHEICQAPIFAF